MLTRVMPRVSTSVFRQAPGTVAAVTVPSVRPGTSDRSPHCGCPWSAPPLTVSGLPFSTSFTAGPHQRRLCPLSQRSAPEVSGRCGGRPVCVPGSLSPLRAEGGSSRHCSSLPRGFPSSQGQAGPFEAGMPRGPFTYCRGQGDRCRAW